MKCIKCGQNISCKDSYCGECGAKINKEEMYLKQKKKWLKIGMISVFFLFLLFVGYSLLRYFTSPSYVAQTYFNAIMQEDYDKIYSYIKEEESLFVSKEILKEKEESEQNIEEIETGPIYEKGNRTYVEFSYTANGRKKRSYVELKKKTYFSLFSTYKVVSGKLASNVTFVVPKNSQITVDGKEIDAFFQENENTGYDTYFIKNMIKGDYEMVLTLDSGLQRKEILTVENGKTYLFATIELEEEQKKELEKKNLENLNILYDAALQDKEYSAVSSSFENDVESLYRQMKREVKKQKITSKNYSDCEIKSTKINKDGNLEVTFLVDYRIQYNKEEIEKTSYITLIYQYKDGKFILIDE